MSGGVMRVALDSVKDYISLRKATFGFELVPLPRNLQSPETSNARGHAVKPKLPPVLPRRAHAVVSQ
jgi:hypothetical protein